NRDDHLSATGCVQLRRLELLSAQGGRHEGVFRTRGRHDDHGEHCDSDNGWPEFGSCELPRLLWRKLVSQCGRNWRLGPIKTAITILRYSVFAAIASSAIRWARSSKALGFATWPGRSSYEKRPSGVGRLGASGPAT